MPTTEQCKARLGATSLGGRPAICGVSGGTGRRIALARCGRTHSVKTHVVVSEDLAAVTWPALAFRSLVRLLRDCATKFGGELAVQKADDILTPASRR